MRQQIQNHHDQPRHDPRARQRPGLYMISHDLELFADYHQFYIWDHGVNPRAPEDYSEEDIQRMVKTAPKVIVIQPVRDMTVPVQIQIHESDPGCSPLQWDHIVECSLELPTGQLQVHESTGGPKLDININAGTWRVRALFSGLDSISEDGLEGNDHYSIHLWPGAAMPLHVVKQWTKN